MAPQVPRCGPRRSACTASVRATAPSVAQAVVSVSAGGPGVGPFAASTCLKRSQVVASALLGEISAGRALCRDASTERRGRRRSQLRETSCFPCHTGAVDASEVLRGFVRKHSRAWRALAGRVQAVVRRFGQTSWGRMLILARLKGLRRRHKMVLELRLFALPLPMQWSHRCCGELRAPRAGVVYWWAEMVLIPMRGWQACSIVRREAGCCFISSGMRRSDSLPTGVGSSTCSRTSRRAVAM